MNTKKIMLGGGALLVAMLQAVAQTTVVFDSGSNGSRGDMVITNNTTIILPPDGILHYKSFKILNNAAVGFVKNANNTPVYLLSQGDISIGGMIYVSGGDSLGDRGPGLGGPGGFDGGRRGISTALPGDGQGPGGGRAGTDIASNRPDSAGGGAFVNFIANGTTNMGAIYGNAALIPLVGGSGGGGTPGFGGGGGGGAILIASNTRIDFGNNDGNHFIDATGGQWGTGGAYNGGSGGAVKLVAPIVTGEQRISVVCRNGTGGSGRVRIDAANFSGAGFGSVSPAYSLSYGNMLATGLEGTLPRLELVSIAGKVLPTDGISNGFILLPNGSPTNQPVVVRTRNFGTKVPVRIVVAPDNGTTQYFDSEVDNTSGAGEKSITVSIPANTPTKVFAWTR